MLPPDVWVIIGSMLKPRHLSRLLRTNKTLLRLLVDNEEYWTRVAAHLVWRGSEGMELNSREFPEASDMLPVEEHNLYYLIGLDCGYKRGMDLFIERIQLTIDARSVLPNDPGPWWAEFQLIPTLRERTVKFYLETSGQHWFGMFLPAIRGDEKEISMRELARRVTEQDWVARNRDVTRMIIKDFVCRMEDANIPAASKRFCFRQLGSLLWRLAADGDEISPAEIGMNMCLF